MQGDPQSRFYAGTPLTSDSGINLGCFFVLDLEPRGGMSNIDRDTLGTVTALIMGYLRVSRQAAEGKRASRLLHGLHLFVNGNLISWPESYVVLPDISGERPHSQAFPPSEIE